MRKSIATDATRAEAKVLKSIWDNSSHPSQAEFGELYNVGNQSAVGQFLSGNTPLSLKAAAGFAKGLGCKISDFSPRLADQAAEYAHLSGLDFAPQSLADLTREEIELILIFRGLPPEKRQAMLGNSIALTTS